jgi:hypothetical protein
MQESAVKGSIHTVQHVFFEYLFGGVELIIINLLLLIIYFVVAPASASTPYPTLYNKSKILRRTDVKKMVKTI